MQKPLREALQESKLLVMNGIGRTDRHKTLHLAFQALHGFAKSQGRLPLPHDDVSADPEHGSRDGYQLLTTKSIDSSFTGRC